MIRKSLQRAAADFYRLDPFGHVQAIDEGCRIETAAFALSQEQISGQININNEIFNI